MAVSWTGEQLQAITLRDRNLLLSAAAGSGKTAVLVSRIMGYLTDREKPVDIDRLLVMTFTRAAAGEMKERIAAALEEAIEADPDNEHLQKQMTLLHAAQITTIDGFCSYIVKNYFHLIGLDPSFRIGEEGEMKLLSGNVLHNVLEERYAQNDPEFEAFVEFFCTGRSDAGLEDCILKLYEASRSNPYPERWLSACVKAYDVQNEEELLSSVWGRGFFSCIEEELQEAGNLIREGIGICLSQGGPVFYEDAFRDDLQFVSLLTDKCAEKDYHALLALLTDWSAAALSRKKAKEEDPLLREKAQGIRKDVKKVLTDLRDRYFPGPLAEVLESVRSCLGVIREYVHVTKLFAEKFAEEKRKRNLLDFSDLEHFTLEILNNDREGELSPTSAARELSLRYEEIMVDEYQDSNLLQEYIMKLVSGWAKDRNNIFMVGDVKQSIYRFRLARPELFMEKYHHYTKEVSEKMRIDLHRNFRSRSSVLSSVNFLFRRMMGEDLGGIAYDDDAALFPGADYPENPDIRDTELLLVDGPDDEENTSAKEAEALCIARRIRSMLASEMVYDRKTKKLRKTEYADIVILLRSAAGYAEIFSDVMEAQGIPCYTVSRTGYFSAAEVQTVLNYLRILDNPRQDIPLSGVMRSPIGAFTSEELAMLRISGGEGLLWDCLKSFDTLEDVTRFPAEKEEGLRCKCRAFLKTYDSLREICREIPVHRLILEILNATEYEAYASALPGGEQRCANLRMLIEKAKRYEKTSYRGLFHFLRYMEQLKKYEVDFGEAGVTENVKNCVRIMTIHKSKGLEFPVVFVAGMGKHFNRMDINDRILMHPEMGIGVDRVLQNKRIRVKTLPKQMIRRQILMETMGEELRILYVAFTRAGEKLVLTGSIEKSDFEKKIQQASRFRSQGEALLPFHVRQKARSPLELLLPALAPTPAMEEYFQEYGEQIPGDAPDFEKEAPPFRIRFIERTALYEEMVPELLSGTDRQLLSAWNPDTAEAKACRDFLEERFSYRYPHEALRRIPVKISVSELKKRNMPEEEQERELYPEKEAEKPVPAFILKEEKTPSGAERGTAYHRVMECLDYGKTEDDTLLREQLVQLVKEEKLSEVQAACVDIADIRRFLRSPLGERMRRAALLGRLKREQPFMDARDAKEIDPSFDEDTFILVQGIIDAYFLEDDDIVLVDYKTDQVKEGEEKRLVEKYRAQLSYYAEALRKMTGRAVKEAYIYSFSLHRELPVG